MCGTGHWLRILIFIKAENTPKYRCTQGPSGVYICAPGQKVSAFHSIWHATIALEEKTCGLWRNCAWRLSTQQGGCASVGARSSYLAAHCGCGRCQRLRSVQELRCADGIAPRRQQRASAPLPGEGLRLGAIHWHYSKWQQPSACRWQQPHLAERDLMPAHVYIARRFQERLI